MVTQAKVLRVVGTTRNAVNYWRSAGFLHTKTPKTTAGVAQELSRENALEIAFMAALTTCGQSPSNAASNAQWLLNSAERQGPWQRYLIVKLGALRSVSGPGEILAELLKTVDEVNPENEGFGATLLEANVYGVVDVARIVETIGALFETSHPCPPPSPSRGQP